MKKLLILSIIVVNILLSGCMKQAPYQVKLNYEENKTPTYAETIEHYQNIAKSSPIAKLIEIGKSDIGKPLHLLILSKSKEFNPEKIKEKDIPVLYINNGIHPGESCGIDASLQFASDVINNKDNLQDLLDHMVICIVPIYNIGGAINRSAYHRANQNGPEEHGFRANARNLDLNRDFIKMDSRNVKGIIKSYQQWKPIIFIDTHTSNGADYQYVMTLLSTHPNNLTPKMADVLQNELKPYLFENMKKSGYEMTPYVNVFRQTPDKGFAGFVDEPRYSSGYAGLFNSIGFTTETHMFKPYRDRVLSTYFFIKSNAEYLVNNGSKLHEIRRNCDEKVQLKEKFPISWKMDSTKFDTLNFKGYTAKYKPSNITGAMRLYYDRNEPFTKEVPFYDYYDATDYVYKPDYYVIPQAWYDVISRLKINGIEMKELDKDTIIEVDSYYVEDYSSPKQPYNGHYFHNNVSLTTKTEKLPYYKGDYIVSTKQSAVSLLIHTLEPKAPDSYFRWNFFDATLSRKEYFSSYVFEETAEQLLKENPELKSKFEQRKKEDEKFRENARAQLGFIYQHSPYSEPTYKRYPIGRIVYKK